MAKVIATLISNLSESLVEDKYGVKRALSTFIQEAIKEKLEKEERSERSKRNRS